MQKINLQNYKFHEDSRPFTVDWIHSKSNIIYVPFADTNIPRWYQRENINTHYKFFLIPDKVQVAGYPVRGAAKYSQQLRKELKGIQVIKSLKRSVTQPVIADL